VRIANRGGREAVIGPSCVREGWMLRRYEGWALRPGLSKMTARAQGALAVFYLGCCLKLCAAKTAMV
jgi:hypothetical protein